MNILSITASDSSVGGASRVAMDLHQYYGLKGHGAHVLTGKKSSDLSAVSELRRPLWRKAAAFALANDFEYFDGEQVLASEHFQKADIVHCHNLSGWYFNLSVLPRMSARKPVVWTLHDMWALTPHASHTTSRQLQFGLFEISDPTIYPATLWNNDRHLARRKAEIYDEARIHVVTPCHWLADLVQQTRLGDKPLTVLPNGVDMTRYDVRSKAVEKTKLGLSSAPLVLFVGAAAQNNPFKGYADFEWLANASGASGYQFICLGADVDAIVGKVVHVKATADKARVASFLSAADVLVMPSRHEVFPLIMIEALASGTPVIAYDVGGIGELLASVPSCTLVPPGNRDVLRAAVVSTFGSGRGENDKEEPARLRRYVENDFSLDAMGSRYLSLFEELVHLRGQSR